MKNEQEEINRVMHELEDLAKPGNDCKLKALADRINRQIATLDETTINDVEKKYALELVLMGSSLLKLMSEMKPDSYLSRYMVIQVMTRLFLFGVAVGNDNIPDVFREAFKGDK
jgi:hypothetical protein